MPRHPQTEIPGRMPSDIDDDPPIWPDDVEVPQPRNWKLLAFRMRLAVDWFEEHAAGLDDFSVSTTSRNRVDAHFGTLTRGSVSELRLRELFRGCPARKETKTGGAESFTVAEVIPGVLFRWRVCGHRQESKMRDEVVTL